MGLTKVSTDGVKDDAITSGKIPANAVGASELADNAVDTNAIANNAVTAGKTSGVQTTINNNADNRVITGSGTANTLEGESGLTYSSNELTVTEQITVDSPDNVTSFAGDYALKLQGGDTINDVVNIRFATDADGSLAQVSALAEATGAYPNSSGSLILSVQSGGAAYEGLRINSARNIGIGIASPAKKLHVFESGEARIRLETGDSRGQAFDLLSTNGAGTNTGTLSIRNESNQSFIDFSHNGGSPFTKIYNTGSQQFTFDSDGLKFGSDTAAANALNDYEEGTCTLILESDSNPATTNSSGATDLSITGSYVKIGKMVTVTGLFNNLHSAGSSTDRRNHGLKRVRGLPFTSYNGTGQSIYTASLGYSRGIYGRYSTAVSVSNLILYFYLTGGNTIANCAGSRTDIVSTAYMAVRNSTSDMYMQFQITYPTT